MTASRAPRVPVPTQRHLVPADLAGQVESLRGRVCVLANADGAHYGWRVWSAVLDVQVDGPWLEVVREAHWWAMVYLAVAPRRLRWPAGAVFVEDAAP